MGLHIIRDGMARIRLQNYDCLSVSMVNHNSIRSKHRYVKKTQGYVNWEDFFRKQKFIQFICIGKNFLFFQRDFAFDCSRKPTQ